MHSLALRVFGRLVLTALLLMALPAAAAAQATAAAQASPTAGPTEYHFSTAITTVYGSKYPVAGHLDLQVFPSGTLRGYYHNAYQKAFIQVVGGRDGDYIWFDIGPTIDDLGLAIAAGGKLHVVATMSSDNSFRGQAYPEFPEANVSATSVGTSPNDQYIFAAKPIEKSSEDYPGTGH
jgi:hypothetical protein